MRTQPVTDPSHIEPPLPTSPPAGGADAAMHQLRPRICLDGEWTFQFGDEQPQTIQVPAPWESQFNDLVNRAGTAVYERSFTVPAHFEGRRVLLQFDAVDYFTEVWINGISVGTHEGGYTPFAFPIEHALHGYGPDVVHTVLVRVTDATVEQDAVLPNGEVLRFAEIPHGKQSWYTSVGGIWQSVQIEALPNTYLDGARFVPNIDAGEAQAAVCVAGLGERPGTDWVVRISVEAPQSAG